MKRYDLTPEADNDVFEIWQFIAADSIRAADRVEDAIHSACAFLANSPVKGHRRRDLTHRFLRFWTLPRFPNYTIIYDPETTPLQIIRILHGARNISALLGED